jgi:hypothetical protein
MNDKIEKKEVKVLENASMEYPTWGCFDKIISEAKDKNFPSSTSNFGCKPIQCPNNTLVPVTVLNSNIVGGDFAGIDVPVLLKPDTNINEKTIVIVGESPLRDTNDPNNKKIVLLGTPYAVHQEFDAPSQCNVYKKIFSDLLKEGYSVYLTDIIKVWWKDKGKDKGLKADENDKEIFKNEINEILKGGKKIGKDLFIIAWGNKAGGVLEKDYPFLIKLLHPSQQNWNNWKLHIFEKAIYDKKDITYATSQYPQKDSKTNEVIVASEAIKEILENVKKIEKDFKKYLNIDEEKLVEYIADDFKDLGTLRKDLVKAGNKGLTMASKKTFGNNAYTAWCIRQKMLQILNK